MISRKNLLQVAILVVVVLGITSIQFTVAKPAPQTATSLKFDIAENPTRFVFDETPIHADDKMPAYGGEFITQGYIYPEGTLNGTNGVLKDGKPEFPDKVIGEWTCRGWHIGDGGHTKTGYWVMSTQTYSLNEANGNAIIVTDGYESPEIKKLVTRAITGGTGAYSSARGEQVQQLLGFTSFQSVNIRVELKITN
jgi:hypothetical protein